MALTPDVLVLIRYTGGGFAIPIQAIILIMLVLAFAWSIGAHYTGSYRTDRGPLDYGPRYS